MTTITTRAGKGSPLLNSEVDANFTNLNDDKAELSGANFTGSIDVTGTVTADGLTVESGAANIGIVTKSTDQYAFIGFEDNTSSASSVYVGADGNDFIARANSLTRFRAASNGDISLYEDTGTTAKFFWDASAERLGIGTSSPEKRLHIFDSTQTNQTIRFGNPVSAALADINYSSIGYEHLYISVKGTTTGYGNIVFSTGPTPSEAFRVDSSGNLLVGTTGAITTGNGFSVNSTGQARIGRASTGSIKQIIFSNPNGEVGSITTSGSATAFNTSSDQRLKDNIVDAPSASDDIDAIQVRSFDWKADGSHQKYGMVAQELQSVVPEAVSGDADSDDMMGVDYSKLVPMMLKEIQSLRARVAQLEGEN